MHDDDPPNPLFSFHERAQLEVVWFLGDVTVDDLRRWVVESFPGRLSGLQHRRPLDADFTNATVVLSFIRHRAGLGLATGANDGGFLHEVAQRALSEGYESLALDLVEFYSPTGFACLTRAAPNAPLEQEWLDPQRALAPSARADQWIAQVTRHETLEDFVLQMSVDPGPSFGGIRVRSNGKLEPRLQAWCEGGVSFSPHQDITDHSKESDLYGWSPPRRSATTGRGLAAFLALSALLVAASVVASVALAPPRLGFAVLQGIVTTAITGWFGLLDFRRPGGEALPDVVSFIGLGCLPGSVPILMSTLGVVP